ncbi:hypothetical protein ACHAXT_001612 [Thalassiosira profunda]
MTMAHEADPKGGRSTMKRRQAAAATSPLAMGRALVLLATSCAALGTHTISAGRAGRGSSHSRSLARHRRVEGAALHTSVALYYKEGDHEQSPEMRAANQSAVEAAAGGRTSLDTASATPTTTRAAAPAPFALFALPGLNLAPAPRSKEDLEHDAMDEYIEYYERRYSRLHPHKQHAGHHQARGHQARGPSRPQGLLDLQLPRKIFLSTLSFHRSISAPAPKPAARSGDEDEEDALHVLGLERLASDKLKHKLHVPRDLRDEYESLTSSTEHAVNFLTHRICSTSLRAAAATAAPAAAATSPAATAASVAACPQCATYPSLSFPDQCRLLVATTAKLVRAFARTVRILAAFAGRAGAAILERGGCRCSVRMAGAAAVAAVLMFRPLFRGAMRQG